MAEPASKLTERLLQEADECDGFADDARRVAAHMAAEVWGRRASLLREAASELEQAERRIDACHRAGEDDPQVGGLESPREARKGRPALLPAGSQAAEGSDDLVRDDPRPDGLLAEKVEDQRRHLNKLQRKYETVKGQLRLEREKLEQAEKALAYVAARRTALVAFGLESVAFEAEQTLAVLAGQDKQETG